MSHFITRPITSTAKGLTLRVGPVAVLFLLGHVLAMSGIVFWTVAK